MSKCFKCKGEFPSSTVLDIHKRHCDGTAPVATRSSRRMATPAPSARLQASSKRVSTRISQRQQAPVVPLYKTSPSLAVSIQNDAHVGAFATTFMGLIIWGCYVAMCAATESNIWALVPLSAVAIGMGIASFVVKRSPNDVAEALMTEGPSVWQARAIASCTTFALSGLIYLSTTAVFGFGSVAL